MSEEDTHTDPGRHSTPVEVILRLLIYKHLYGWSFQETDPLALRSTSQALGGRDALQSGSGLSQSIAQFSPSNIGSNA